MKKLFVILVLYGIIFLSGIESKAAWSSNLNVVDTICYLSNFSSRMDAKVVKTSDGNYISAWVDLRIGWSDVRIYSQKIDKNGNKLWDNNGIIVMSGATSIGDFQLVESGSGAIVTWLEKRNGNADFYIHASKINSDGTIAWTLGVETVASAIFLKSCSDGSGGIVMTWTDSRGGSSNFDIYCQRVSSDGSAQWGANGKQLTTGSTKQEISSVCRMGSNFVFAWDDQENDASNTRIYVQLVNSSGDIQWAANGIKISTMGWGSTNAVASDGTNIFVTWQAPVSNAKITSQKLNSSGVKQWPGEGIVTCRQKGPCWSVPEICIDGSGGMFAMFNNNPIYTDTTSVYLQHINSNGTTSFDTTAINLSGSYGNIQSIQYDNNGYAIACWLDYNGIVNAQKIDINGNLMWDDVESKLTSKRYADDASLVANPEEIVYVWSSSGGIWCRAQKSDGSLGLVDIPKVSTDTITNIAIDGATIAGSVTNNGGEACTAYGIHINGADSTGVGTDSSWTYTSIGLASNTQYTYYAYGTNSAGTGYGDTLSFYTLPETPTLNSSSGVSIGGFTITWNDQSDLPSNDYDIQIDDNNDFSSPAINVINQIGTTYSATGLNSNTKYYYRIRAGNNTSLEYSAWSSGTNYEYTLPETPTINATSSIGKTAFTINYSDNSDLASSNYDIQVDNNNSFASNENSITNKVGLSYIVNTGLVNNTYYYYRIRAHNSISGYYSAWSSGAANQTTQPDVTGTDAIPIANIEEITATGGGTVALGGNAGLSARGVCWATASNPTIAGAHSHDASVLTGNQTSSIVSIVNNTYYYVRAYATNAGGTTYGPEVTFTSKANCYTGAITSITSDSGFVTGAIAVPLANQGGTEAITERGFVWSNSTNTPTTSTSLSSFKKLVGTGYGLIPTTVLRFPVPSETYYVRSYAINAGGTSYGNIVSVTTSLNSPYDGDGSISLNFIHSSGWIDNNNDNTNPTAPSNNNPPSDLTSDGDFPKNGDNGGSGNWQSWEFNGDNQCFQIPYNSNNDRLNNNSQKALFIYFRTSTLTANTPINQRQILLELGGTNSGLNVYIYSGKVWVGIWNSTQRRYFSKSIETDRTYLLNVEFNGTKVRTALDGECSSSMLFSGFASNSNSNGVGASVNGTRYMDLTRTSGVNDYYEGRIAEVLMYNDCSQALRVALMNFFDQKYKKNYSLNYTAYFGKVAAESNWDEYESEVSPFDNNDNVISNLEVYKSQKELMINLNLDESENIELAIFDLNGIKVGTISNNELKKGINNFTYSTENLVSGVYIVRAIGLSVNESVKVNIVK